ncbi:interleukin-20 receptor subunit beta [Ursus maritimus]|uniref:Interleukin-20 receptor subunit beta n=1 Tax=Ursus maritimus TaxID=29073 RepID=A0A8M1GAP7_URSMA|nr:interleukin-20 receptor subunit beta isoform X2 [Ursus arctos]XP_040492711.1 interleukin-20 receptor subunit beta [Ursus maritimus]
MQYWVWTERGELHSPPLLSRLGCLLFLEQFSLQGSSDLSSNICILKQGWLRWTECFILEGNYVPGRAESANTDPLVVLEEILTSLIMWFFYALIPCLLIGGVAILPAPQNLSVQSTNMKHLLMWSPVIVPGEIIYYFVEYQGEYESLYMSHIWIPSSWCSPTEGPECDITDDVTATVPYNLRVRATVGAQTSAWSTLQHPFNRNSTVLTPPVMEVTKDGFHLVIKLEDLGPQFEFLVAYWRREPGAKEHVKVVKSRGIPVHLGTMEPGAAYCVKVRTFVKAIGRHSPFSQAECVKVQGETLPLTLALFAFVGLMLILVVVPVSVWKMGRLLRYSCCPVVVLPDTLKITNSPQKLISCRREEVEACATAVLSSEEPFRAWI